MPKVSILLASYNHAAFIKRTIESIQRQTFQDFEIIVVIDGSTDNTREVLNSIVDERLHVYELPYNQGISAASNEGLKHCNGEYIAILDSDDMFREDKLSRQVEFLDNHPECGTVCTQATLIDENDLPYEDKTHPYYTIFKQKNRSQAEWLKYFFFVGNCICHPSLMVRKNIFDKVGRYNVSMQQVPDFDIVVRLAAAAPFFLIEEEMVYVRVRKNLQNNSSYTAEKDLRNQFEQVELLETYTNLSVELAQEVFKDYLEDIPLTKEMVPYIAARAGLATSWACAKYFGEKTLSRLLKDDETRELLKERYEFTTKKFYDLLGIQKVFDSNHIDVHKLYVAQEDDFKETFKLEKPTRIYYLEQGFYQFDHTFHLDQNMIGMKHFRWDPTESNICGIWIDSISAQDKEGNWHEIYLEKIRTNAARKIRNGFIFLTTDPMILFKTDCAVVAVRIKATIQYTWDFLLKKYPELIERELVEYYEETAEKEFYTENLILKKKNTNEEILYIPRGAYYAFKANTPVHPGMWTSISIDERLYAQNSAIVMRDLTVKGIDRNGESTSVMAVIETDKTANEERIFYKDASVFIILPDTDTVEISVEGDVSSFAEWDLAAGYQPAAMEWHPLRRIRMSYQNRTEEEALIGNAIMNGETASVVFKARYLPQKFHVRLCNGAFGALRLREAYAINTLGKRIEICQAGAGYKKWDFFTDHSSVVEFVCDGFQENSIVVIKYDIILGGLRKIIKGLLRKSPTDAVRLLAKKVKKKVMSH